MSALTLYLDESCTEILGSGFVGRYSKIYGSVPSVNTESKTVTIDDEQVKFTGLFHYNQSTIDSTEATEFIIPMSLEPENNGETNDVYLYFTPYSRIHIRLKKNNNGRRIFSGYNFGYKDNNNQWQSCTNWHEPSVSNYSNNIPFSISFRTAKTASYNSYGTIIDVQNNNFMGFDVHTINSTQHAETSRCLMAIAPFDKFYRDKEEEPYTPDTGTPRHGGTGSGTYPNSAIPALPTGSINAAFSSVLGTGNGLTYYKLTGNSLNEITEFLYDCSLSLKFRNSQYRDAIASLVFVPFNVGADVTNTLGIVYLANKSITVSGGCDIILNPLKEINFGEINLTANNIGYKSFADYIHTTAVLYLPCVGNINIDMSAFTGGILSLRGVIDVRTGNILYRLESRAEMDDIPVLYGHYNGNCGIPVPIGGANNGVSILGAISSIGTIGVGVATGNPLNIVGGISGLATQTAPTIDTAGAMQPNTAAMGTPVPVLQIRKRVMCAPPDYAEISGIPSDSTIDGVYDSERKTLSGYSGFFKAAECDVSGISGATESEKAEIEMLLKGGVYL